MNLYNVTEVDHKQQVAAVFSIAELKAIYNALLIDVSTIASSTSGVDNKAVLARISQLIAHKKKALAAIATKAKTTDNKTRRTPS